MRLQKTVFKSWVTKTYRGYCRLITRCRPILVILRLDLGGGGAGAAALVALEDHQEGHGAHVEKSERKVRVIHQIAI